MEEDKWGIFSSPLEHTPDMALWRHMAETDTHSSLSADCPHAVFPQLCCPILRGVFSKGHWSTEPPKLKRDSTFNLSIARRLGLSQNCEVARIWPLGGSKAPWFNGRLSKEHLKTHRMCPPTRFGLSPRSLQTAAKQTLLGNSIRCLKTLAPILNNLFQTTKDQRNSIQLFQYAAITLTTNPRT